MDNSLIAMVLLALSICSGSADCASLGLLIPVQQGEEVATKPGPGGTPSPILRPAPDDPLSRALMAESRRGTVAFVLKLDEQAQRLSGQALQPSWLLLTEEEGGFAKRGFWLRQSGRDRFIDQPYVALLTDPASIADGSFEEIFSHELGHVLLRRVLPRLPAGMSRVNHGSLTVTDDPTALDEGFAIHFQALSRLLTVNSALKAHDAGLGDKAFTPLWQSNVDGTFRIDGVRRNWFIHRQLLPPGDDDALARRANSSAFDVAALKNGNQMMASEGVVATLFYRAMAARPSVARYASLFRALQHLNHQELRADSPLLPLLVQAWMVTDPAQGRRFLHIFVESTYGATIESALPQSTVALAQVGRIGQQAAFVKQLKAAREQIAALIVRVEREPALLSAALGPALWLAATGPLVVNLNTAEADELAALDRRLAGPAMQIVAERDAHGPYQSLNDLVQRTGLAPPLPSTLTDLAASASALGPYSRL
jgi:DNA uptake protein ComE-like DNA-binding protein